MTTNPVLEVVRLGSSSVEVTRLGLGTAPLGGWPTAVPHAQALATVERAYELGIRYVDTAPFYGAGVSELLVGDALSARRREQFVVSTKVGRVLVPGEMESPLFEGARPFNAVFDFSRTGVERSLADSYERLRLDRVDIALIHDPDEHHREALERAYPVLAELRSEGRIGAVGVGMNYAEPLARFVGEADFDCMLCAGRYTLLEQDSLDTLMPAALERNVSIIAGGVYNSGLLADPRPGAPYDYAPAPDALVERAQRLGAVCRRFDVPLRAAAIQFPLAHPAVACVVVGARSPEEVEDNLAMLYAPIPAELWSALREEGLLRSDAPVPAERSTAGGSAA